MTSRQVAPAVAFTLFASLLALSQPDDDLDVAQDLARFFDRDHDGVVERWEAADAVLLLHSSLDRDGDGSLEVATLSDALLGTELSVVLDVLSVSAEFDADADQRVSAEEWPGDNEEFLEADADADGFVTVGELSALFASEAGSESPYQMMAREILAEHDTDEDGVLRGTERPMGLLLTRPLAGDVGLAELAGILRELEAPASFEVQGERAIMNGVIGPSTPARVLALRLDHPHVHTIVMQDVPGSMDDHSMLRAAQFVRQQGLRTHLPEHAEVASGGTDFFLAGSERTRHPSARLGVHSWSGGEDEEGANLPQDHPEHGKYLAYYREMGIPDAFYWYTLQAAPADDIHWMTDDEIDAFGVLTE